MTAIPEHLATPDTLNSSLGELTFTDGAPSDDTVKKVFDNLDASHAFNAYRNGYQLVSLQAMHNGMKAAGVKDNGGVLLFSGLMDSQSLFLTANADTVYYIFVIDLTDGPMVVETPPDALGLFDDFWFQHVIDFGRPGPDRGRGRQVPHPPAGLRRPRSRQRLSRCRQHHEPGHRLRPQLHGRQRPRSNRGDDQGPPEDLPVSAGRVRHECRHPARGWPGAQQAGGDQADRLRRGNRAGDQHRSAQ